MCFIFTPGEMIHFDEHIFQMGWFSHQLDQHWSEHLFDEAHWDKVLSRLVASPPECTAEVEVKGGRDSKNVHPIS